MHNSQAPLQRDSSNQLNVKSFSGAIEPRLIKRIQIIETKLSSNALSNRPTRRSKHKQH